MKNLYVETFVHYSPKDSEGGNLELFIATPDEAFERVREKLYLDDIESWKDEDGEGNEIYYTEEELKVIARKFIEEGKGNNNTFDDEEYISYDDLYYGMTTNGYKLIKENISEDDIDVLVKLKLIYEMK